MSDQHWITSQLNSRLRFLIDEDPVEALTEARNPDDAGFAWHNPLSKDCERPAWGPHFF
jgi:hypothetical protein